MTNSVARVSISLRFTIYSEFDTKEQRGEVVGAYVVVKTDDGDYLTHTMRIEDIYSIRDRSEAWKKYKTDNSKKMPVGYR
ncbi:Recombinational DNA repair protein (RecE pathway) [Cronobacter sakazakii]|nr:Recombinational DNA repair protein (RecE pathway) [Cronobacter sakazakii]